MKLRSRVAAVAAAAGLAAGLLIVGGGGVAQSQDALLLDCDRVAGSGSIKPALSEQAQVIAASVKGPLVANPDPALPFKPVTTTRDCTGILATPGGGTTTPDDVGPLTKVSGKLVGSGSCNLTADPPVTDPLDPLDGKLGLTFTTLDPNLKPYASSTYIRVGLGNGSIEDELATESGIVTKGPGSGADVRGSFLFAPYDAKTKGDFDSNPNTAPTLRPDQSVIDSNSELTGGSGSQIIGLGCQFNQFDIATIYFSTDGTSIGTAGGDLDSSLQIVLPDDTP